MNRARAAGQFVARPAYRNRNLLKLQRHAHCHGKTCQRKNVHPNGGMPRAPAHGSLGTHPSAGCCMLVVVEASMTLSSMAMVRL